MKSWSFWLGIAGSICGYLLVFIVIGFYLINSDFKGLLFNIFVTGLFASLGLVAAVLDSKKMLNGGLFLIAGLGVAITYMPYSFIPAFFFLPAGLINLLDLLNIEQLKLDKKS